ncbi:MAG: methyltransferase domain-containing protein [Dokdonella sp.]
MTHRRHSAAAAAISAASIRDLPIRWAFFQQWLRNPRAIAALAPSSRVLARAMIAQLPESAERIIEFGGGTGVFTRGLIEHGVGPDQLMVVELNGALHRMLKRRFPATRVVRGDARNVAALVAREKFAEVGGVDAVVSGLGLLSMSREVQREVLAAAFSVLKPGGRFIQFTYGPVGPVPRELLGELDLNSRRASVAWFNVPPATVYVYTRNRSTAVHAVRAPLRVPPRAPNEIIFDGDNDV